VLFPTYGRLLLKQINLLISILRCFVLDNNKLLVRVFVVYVRPLLEFNSVIWSSCLKRDIGILEKVQRRLTKRLGAFREL